MANSSADLVNASQKLRAILSAYDNASLVLEGSFLHIDPELEALARSMRLSLNSSIDQIMLFLHQLEQTPAFVESRAARLKEYTR